MQKLASFSAKISKRNNTKQYSPRNNKKGTQK
jgi:hypothetical protein